MTDAEGIYTASQSESKVPWQPLPFHFQIKEVKVTETMSLNYCKTDLFHWSVRFYQAAAVTFSL